MRSKQVVLAIYILAMVVSLFVDTHATAADPTNQSQGPGPAVQGAEAPLPSTPAPDPVANLDTRLGAIEEWKPRSKGFRR